MIIFTEHNEVVMSVSELRDLIREAARISIKQANANLELDQHMNPVITKPSTFIIEDTRDILEKRIKHNRTINHEED